MTNLIKLTLSLTFFFAAQFSKAQISKETNCHLNSKKIHAHIIEITNKLELPEDEILRLPENEQSEFRQALGQLSFITKEVKKDLTKASELYNKQLISNEEYCQAVVDANENAQAIETDLLVLVKKLAFNF